MFLETGAVLSLAAQCAPAVAPHTIAAIVDAESSNYVFAINVNGVASQPRRPRNEAEAIATARSYVARGYSVDLGLGQINSRNMGWLGLTWDTVFKQCSNIEAAGRVLLSNFRRPRRGAPRKRPFGSHSACITQALNREVSATAMSPAWRTQVAASAVGLRPQSRLSSWAISPPAPP